MLILEQTVLHVHTKSLDELSPKQNIFIIQTSCSIRINVHKTFYVSNINHCKIYQEYSETRKTKYISTGSLLNLHYKVSFLIQYQN